MPASFIRTFTDSRDGTVYPVVLMPDGKWWAAENLRWDNSIYAVVEDGRFFYRPYDWAIIAPPGAHIPSHDDFQALFTAVGPSAGVKLRASSGWGLPNSGPLIPGTDDFGFNLLPTGYLQNGAGSYRYDWDRSALLGARQGQLEPVYAYATSSGDLEFSPAVGGSGPGAVRAMRFIVDPENLSTVGTFIDARDKKSYAAVLMPDGKWWSAENLAYDGGGGLFYENSPANAGLGRYYPAVSLPTIAPPDAHIPTVAEWRALITAIGGFAVVNSRLRSRDGWSSPQGADSFGLRVRSHGLGTLNGAYWTTGDGPPGVDGYYASLWVRSEVANSVSKIDFYTDNRVTSDFVETPLGDVSDYRFAVRFVIDRLTPLVPPIPTLAPVGDTLRRLLIEQYKDKPRMEGILAQIGVEADMLDASNHELWNIYDLDTAIGAQLDILGTIANEARRGRTDAEYRALLKVLFRTQVSGTPEDVIRSVKEYTGATAVTYIPEYPAAFWIIPNAPGLTLEFLERVSPTGVGAYPACYLSLTTGELIETTDGESILVVGPCPPAPPPPMFPTDNVWDGGVGAGDPATRTIPEAWPFRDGDGVGEYPDGGLGAIDPSLYTFTDGSYADDTGGT